MVTDVTSAIKNADCLIVDVAASNTCELLWVETSCPLILCDPGSILSYGR
jgi:hypothetical protein